MSAEQEEIAKLRAELAALRSGVTPPVVAQVSQGLKLDLGAGPRPREGFQGVDIVEGVTDHCFDLCSGFRWPFEDNSVEELHSSHFIEHIKNDYIKVYGENDVLLGEQDALFRFFDEAYRVAKPGATFTVIWPALQSVRAFQDPTHRRFIPHFMIAYLSVEGRKAMGVEHYNVKCNWEGTVNPTIPTDESTRSPEVQAKRFAELWNVAADFHAVLKAVK